MSPKWRKEVLSARERKEQAIAREAVRRAGGDSTTDWADITGKPSSFTPASHGHNPGDITGDVSPTRKFLTSQGTGAAEQDPTWTTLSSGDMAAHSHGAGDITSGTLGIARGGTGLNTLGSPGQVLTVNGGGTDLEYTTLSGGGPIPAHATNHENGGVDEIDVTDLSGLLADPQTPLSHFHDASDINAGTLNIARLPSHGHAPGDITGDISATRKFLTSVGTGAAEQDPTWTVLASGDIPSHGHSAADITSGVLDAARLPAASTTAAGAVELATSLETTAGLAVQASDSRLTDARTPATHASSHQSGGTDAIKLDDLAAPDDNTDLNASTSNHGLLPKLGGGTTNFLRADGSWSAPPGGPGAATSAALGTVKISGTPTDAANPVVYVTEQISVLLNPKVELAGQIGGTVVSPTILGMRETGGPTLLTYGAVADGQVLIRSGATVVGATRFSPTYKLTKTSDQTIGTTAAAITWQTAAGVTTALALAASKRYEFRALMHYTQVAAATVHAARTAYSGTLGTGPSVSTVTGTNGVPSVWAAAGRIHTLAVNGTMPTTTGGIGNTGAAATLAQFEVEGTIQTNASGNLTIEAISSAASGLVVKAGSVIEIWEPQA